MTDFAYFPGGDKVASSTKTRAICFTENKVSENESDSFGR